MRLKISVNGTTDNGRNRLKRCLGMCETITITVGTVIGVGLFTVGANVVGLLGPMVILATLAAMLISIYPSLLYAEMSAALPFAGGTYQYASAGLGRPFGMLAGWNFVISMISVASGESLAFSFYIRTLFEALGIPLPIDDRWIACLALVAFLFLSIRGTEITGRLQNGFLFFFWGVAAVWILCMLPSMNFSGALPVPDAENMTPFGFLSCVAMIWWCFAGFETCCAMGEEIRNPQIVLPRTLFLAPFIVFAVNGIFQWALLCIVPPESLSSLATAAAPYAEGMKLAGVLGFPLILLCLGIAFGGDFSTINASMSAPARYLYTMARDRVLPKIFAWLHPRWKTPVFSILVPGLLMILLVCTNSITYIASLSLFATLFYYIIGMAAACGLRVRKPGLIRPYRVRLIWLGAPISILIYLFMITQLESSAILAGLLWSLLGIAVFFICRRKYSGESTKEILTFSPLPPLPTPAEKRHMDREFHIWCGIVSGITVLVLLLNLGILFR